MLSIGRRATTSFIIAALAFTTVSWPAASFGAPTNAKIRAKQAQAEEASEKLEDLADDLELKKTELEAIEEALYGTRNELAAATERLAAEQTRLELSEAVLADRVASIYRNGTIDLVAVLLGTSDFQDFVTRLDLLNRISTSDAELVVQVENDRNRVDQTRMSLENRANEEAALRAQADASAREVQSAVDTQAAFVKSLKDEVKRLVKKEADRRAREAAELARLAEQAASRPSVRPSDAGSLGPSHPEALAVAKKYLGVPYVWGGSSPSGFDCSGLMQYSYGKIGISIPRTSRTQFGIGQFIPPSRTDLLEPGDLVFFGYGGNPSKVHHVGMYAGGGVFIHAPSTGDVVRYASLGDRIRRRGDYVGAVRP